MKQLLAICAFLCFFSTISIAQNPMHRLYEPMDRQHFALDMVPYSSGFYLMNGVDVDPGMFPFLMNTFSVTKVDEKGDLIWTNNYSFPNIANSLNANAQLELFAGDTLGILLKIEDAAPLAANELVMIIEPDGDVVVSKALGGHDDAMEFGPGAFLTIASEVNYSNQVVLASVSATDAFEIGLECTAIDNLGNIIWSEQKMFTNNETGVPFAAIPRDGVRCNVDSTIVFSGVGVFMDNTPPGAFLVKLDTMGNTISADVVTTNNPDLLFFSNSIACSSDSSTVVAGNITDQMTGVNNGAISYLDSNNDVVWSKSISFGPMSTSSVSGLVSVEDGYVASVEVVDLSIGLLGLFIIKFDKEGIVQWRNFYSRATPFPNPFGGNQMHGLIDNFTSYHGTHFNLLNGELANNLLVIDESGFAICNDTIDIEIFSDIDLLRMPLAFSDTTKIASEDIEVEMLNVDSIYNIPELSLSDTTYCPQDPIMFTLDGNYEGGFEWIWSTEETTPTIVATEEGEFSVTVTADNEYGCYIQCDTATIATYDTLMLLVSIDTGPWCETRMVNYSADILPGNIRPSIEYLWSTGETTPDIALPVPSEASVTVTDGCDIQVFGMASIQEDPDTPDEFGILFNTDRYCSTGEFELQIFSDPASNVAGLTNIVWFDAAGAEIGSSTNNILVEGFGTYSFTGTDNCNFDVGQTITFSENDLPAIGSITTNVDYSNFCLNGGDVIVTATFNGTNIQNFQWDNGSTNLALQIPFSETTVSYTATDCGRPISGSETIGANQLPPVGTITITADDSQLCDLGVVLNASSVGSNLFPNTFIWSNSVMGAQIVIDDFEPTYMVTGQDCGREVTAEINYTPSLDQQVAWPNIFFPENPTDAVDSIDNFFGPMIECPELVEDYELRVYNRWGQLMFETTDATIDWDGRKDGDNMPGDAYVFYARYTINGVDDEVNGTVTLVR